MRLFCRLMLISILILSAASLRADWLQKPHQVGEFSGQPFYQGCGHLGVAADDWLCSEPTEIGLIQWWGTFHGWTGTSAPTVTPTQWRITLYSDVPSGVDVPYSHPGQIIDQRITAASELSFAGYSALGGVESVFFFEAMPEQRFVLEGPAIYWLSITAVYDDGASATSPWCWLSRPYFWGAASTSGLDESPYWLPNTSGDATWDQTFSLTVPEPASATALIFAGFAAILRRRWPR